MKLYSGQIVRLFYVGADLRVVDHQMTLGEALDAFEAMPHARQSGAGIALHEPEVLMIDGRQALSGFLNATHIKQVLQIMRVAAREGDVA